MYRNTKTVLTVASVVDKSNVCRFLFYFSEGGFGNDNDWNVIEMDVNFCYVLLLCYVHVCNCVCT